MNQQHPKGKFMKDRVLKTLQDANGGWVSANYFYANFMPTARNRIGELRQEGYTIESEKEKGKPTFRYRLIGEEEQFRKAIAAFHKMENEVAVIQQERRAEEWATIMKKKEEKERSAYEVALDYQMKEQLKLETLTLF